MKPAFASTRAEAALLGRQAASSRFSLSAVKAKWQGEEKTGDDGVFHNWRKRVKDHWYHVRLLEGLSSGAASRARALRHLEKCMGEDQNIVVLSGKIIEKTSKF